MTRVLAVVVLLALGMLAPVTAAKAADEDPPVVTSASVTPSSLPKEGGTVTVTATVTDDVGVAQAYVEVNGSDGSYATYALARTTGSTYRGTVDIPGNPTEEERSYTINVFAADAAENYSEAGFAGEVSVAAEPQMDPFPWVSNSTIDPRNLPSGGGDVAIGAIATDNRDVSEVFARITGPGGYDVSVEMLGDGTSHYEGVFTAPANPTSSARQYAVTIYALDDIGQEDSEDAGKITVAGTGAAAGELNAHLVGGAFGRVKVGRSVYRRIKVANHAKPGTPPVLASAVLTGSPAYSIVGPTAFRVKPRQARYLLVRFAPTAPGQAQATVTINGTGPEVRLTGRGVSS